MIYMYFLLFIKIVRMRKGFLKPRGGPPPPSASMYAKRTNIQSNLYNLGYHNKNIKHKNMISVTFIKYL